MRVSRTLGATPTRAAGGWRVTSLAGWLAPCRWLCRAAVRRVRHVLPAGGAAHASRQRPRPGARRCAGEKGRPAGGRQVRRGASCIPPGGGGGGGGSRAPYPRQAPCHRAYQQAKGCNPQQSVLGENPTHPTPLSVRVSRHLRQLFSAQTHCTQARRRGRGSAGALVRARRGRGAAAARTQAVGRPRAHAQHRSLFRPVQRNIHVPVCAARTLNTHQDELSSKIPVSNEVVNRVGNL